MKKYIVAIAAVALAITGVAAGSQNAKRVNRLCVYYEVNGGAITRSDVKVSPNGLRTRKVCIVGKPGKNGKPGKAGKNGIDGKAGAIGARGAAGANGVAGAAGANGVKGDAGANGATGEQGVAGAAGADGTNGIDGEQGEQGVAGPVGPIGPQGVPGADGADGADGVDGADGANGLDGSTIVTVSADGIEGEKTTTVACPAGKFALSGGFDAQGSVTASFRTADGTGWTVTQSSGNTDSLKVYVYCV